MQWYEYLIIVATISVVILPIIINIRKRKKGISTCSCGCSNCAYKNNCNKKAKEQYKNSK